MTSSFIEKLMPILKMHSFPVVLVDSYLPLEDTSAVLVDNVCGILKAVKYLVDKGHRKIGYMMGDLADIDCVERRAGFRRGLSIFDLPIDEDSILECKLSISSSYQAMSAFLHQSTSLPTAFIGVNDLVTIGGMQAAKDFGFTVPEEMSFVGFDDIGLSKEISPALTTVHVDIQALGKFSVECLIDLIKNDPVSFHKILINTTIVERNSVAAPIKRTDTNGGEETNQAVKSR